MSGALTTQFKREKNTYFILLLILSDKVRFEYYSNAQPS